MTKINLPVNQHVKKNFQAPPNVLPISYVIPIITRRWRSIKIEERVHLVPYVTLTVCFR